MPNRYSIIEPHPSVPRTGGFIAGGRGGAGNYKRYAASELTAGPTAQGPPSRLNALSKKILNPHPQQRLEQPPSALPSAMSSQQQQPQPRRNPSSTSSSSSSARPSGYASSGIGGAGNMFVRAETEERVFQFDEEMVKRRETGPATPVYHIGRGGGGNWVDETKVPSSSRRMGSASSGSSTGSRSSNEDSGDEGRERTGGIGGKLGRLFKA